MHYMLEKKHKIINDRKAENFIVSAFNFACLQTIDHATLVEQTKHF